MLSHLPLAAKSLKAVFTKPYRGRLVFLFLVIILVNLLINILALNYDLLAFTLTSGLFDFPTKTKVFLNSLLSLTALSPVSLITLVVLSILTAIEITLLIFYFEKQWSLKKEAGLGLSGLFVSFLGVGCSACGSLILSSFLGLSAASLVIGFLPFEGREFGWLGLIILVLAIYLTAYKISLIDNCKINK